MSVKRYWVPGPWITRDLKECVLASDYDTLRAKLDARLGMVTSLLVTNYDLRKERDRLQDALDALRSRLDDLESWRTLIIQRAENAEARLAEADALLQEASSAIDDRLSYLSGDPLAELAARINAHLGREP